MWYVHKHTIYRQGLPGTAPPGPAMPWSTMCALLFAKDAFGHGGGDLFADRAMLGRSV
jgi:hypothetical protein